MGQILALRLVEAIEKKSSGYRQKNSELAADSLRSSAPKQVNPCVGKSELLKKSRLARQNPDSLKSSAPKQVRWLMGLWTEHAVVLQLNVDWPSPILPNVPLLMWGSSKRLASSDVPKVTDLPCKVVLYPLKFEEGFLSMSHTDSLMATCSDPIQSGTRMSQVPTVIITMSHTDSLMAICSDPIRHHHQSLTRGPQANVLIRVLNGWVGREQTS